MTIATEELERRGLEYEILPHRVTTSAREEAIALDVAPTEVGKTLVLVTPDGYVRVVVPASRRLDLHKVRALLDTNDVRLATELELAARYPEFELGAVPPFGGPHERVVVDRRLATLDSLVLEAGTHAESMRIGARDLIALTDADVADVSALDER